MFELISYEKFRDTKDVRFFDISVNGSNYRDLVIHSGPAVSPPNDEDFNNWQFYIHHNQEDNLFCLLYTSPSPRDTILSRMPSSA